MLISRLRQETAALHAAVEDELNLTSPHLTIPEYAHTLRLFFAFWRPWETELAAHCPPQLSALWQGSPRAHKLRDDLAALPALASSGQTPEPPDPIPARDPIPTPAIPSLADPGAWLGSLYVFDGARLGGHVISRHLEQHFGWSNGRGYSFFAGDQAETRARWQALLAALEQHDGQANQIIDGAHLTFKNLLLHFKTSRAL